MGNPQNIVNHKFKKGKPPGPGRPKGSKSMTSILEEIMRTNFQAKNPITKETEKRDVKFWISMALAGKAMKGDMPAIKEVYERIDGKVANILQQGPLNLENLDLSSLSDKQLDKLLKDNKDE